VFITFATVMRFSPSYENTLAGVPGALFEARLSKFPAPLLVTETCSDLHDGAYAAWNYGTQTAQTATAYDSYTELEA
jgi:hypothetical protein